MLARPEIGTPEYTKLWLDGKDPLEHFCYSSGGGCACGQLSFVMYGDNHAWLRRDDPMFCQLDQMAKQVSTLPGGRGTFGDLAKLARETWK